MKRARSHFAFVALASVFASLALSAIAGASPLLFDRGLPTANLNNASGANRSNVAWADTTAAFGGLGTTTAMGDNFTLAYSSVIDTVRVWIVARDTSGPVTSAGAYTLLLGNDLGAGTVVSAVGTGSSIAATTYNGIDTYQATNGDFITLFQLDFAGLNLAVGPGTFAFGIAGPHRIDLTTPFVHASNAPLSGSTQQGSDGFIYGFNALGQLDVSNGYPFNSLNNGWDKSSDINVQVYGTVPEPSTVALIGIAMLSLFGFGLVRRRAAF